MKRTRKLLLLILGLITAVSISACTSGEDVNGSDSNSGSNPEAVFKIGGIPDQSASELNEQMENLARYLSEKSDASVEYVPSQDYAAVVTAFERGDIHMAWFGGLTSVQARNKVENAESIAQRPMDEKFHSVFISKTNSGIKTLEDIKGKTFTFGSESSTSGHLMPRYFLKQNDINPNSDFEGDPNYSGSHDRTYALVESGAFEAGALNESVWNKALESGDISIDTVDVFYTTPDYYDYNWTINSEEVLNEQFGYDIKSEMKDILLNMGEDDSESAREILEFFNTDKFIETENENYKMIEEIATELELLN